MALRLFQLVLKGGKWIRATRPLQLNYRPPTSTSFDTLATIPVSASLQAPVDLAGPRTDTPNASQVPVEVRTVPKPNKSFLGVTIPERPSPPKEGECCMSGCAHCVYDLYMEDIELHHEQVANARAALRAKGVHIDPEDWPKELGQMYSEGVNPKEAAEKEVEASIALLDPSTRAFLEMEQKMKKKQREHEQESKTGGA